MLWKSSHTPQNSGRSDLDSLRVPLGLQVEIRLRDELHKCVQEADWSGLKRVLGQLEEKKASLGAASVAAIVNSRPANNAPTALHLVCGRGESRDLAARLLALGADPNARATIVTMRSNVPSDDRPTPLYCALGCGDLKLTKLLVKHGAAVNDRNSLGESPLLFSVRAQPYWSQAGRAFQKVLMKAGANPTQADLDGMTPFAEHLMRENLWQAEYLAKLSPNKPLIAEGAKQKILSKFVQSGVAALARVDQDSSDLRALLTTLRDFKDTIGPNLVSAILNSPINGGPSLFARMIQVEATIKDIALAESLGASFTRLFDARLKGIAINGVSAFHVAVTTNNPDLIRWALTKVSAWFMQQPVGEQKFTPLHLLYLAEQPINLEAARLLIEAGVDPRAETSKGVNIFEMAVSSGDALGMELWAEYLTNPFIDASPLVRELALHDESIQEQKREFSRFGKMRVGLPLIVENEMKAWAGSEDASEFTKRCKDYLEAYFIAKEPERWIRNNGEMYKLLPRAMLYKRPIALLSIVKAIDVLNDHVQHVRGWHPFQAELMALLAHSGAVPQEEVDKSSSQSAASYDEALELRKAVTLALTSIHRFNNLHIYKVSPSAVNLWSRVGVRSFSFRYQKWDARGIPLGENRGLSPLEMYGFAPLTRDGGEGVDLGAGFELGRERKEQIKKTLAELGVKFDPNVRIQFFQGCKRAFMPGVGDFILRNSSPFFGPHLLKHPAYFSRLTAQEGLPEVDATQLSATTIEQGFMPMMQSSLYVPMNSAVSDMDYLLQHIEMVDNDLDLWKFDTRRETAWETIEGVGTVMKGGYFSDGFSSMVGYLTRLSAILRDSKEPMPHLAFFNRNLPAWRPLPYTDMDGTEYSTLELTPTTLELLRKLQSSSADRNDFRKDNGRAYHFFQMGLDQGASLVIVDGKAVSHDM